MLMSIRACSVTKCIENVSYLIRMGLMLFKVPETRKIKSINRFRKFHKTLGTLDNVKTLTLVYGININILPNSIIIFSMREIYLLMFFGEIRENSN